MRRVVADTNVYLSALLFGGLPATLLQLGIDGRFALITCAVLIAELEEKLREKFAVPEATIRDMRRRVESSAEVVVPKVKLRVVDADPDDDRVLECAVAGNANVIVTGDGHLLKLKSYGAIEILTVRDLFERVMTVP